MPTLYKTVDETREEVFELAVRSGTAVTSSLKLTSLRRTGVSDLNAPEEQRGKDKTFPNLISINQSSKVELTWQETLAAQTNLSRTFNIAVKTNLAAGERASADIAVGYPAWEYRHYWIGDTEYYETVNLTFKLTITAVSFICKASSGTLQLTESVGIVTLDQPNYLGSLGTVTAADVNDIYGLQYTVITAYPSVKPINIKLWPYFKYLENKVDLIFRYVPSSAATPLVHLASADTSTFSELSTGIVDLTLGGNNCNSQLVGSIKATVQIGQPVYEIVNYPKQLEYTYGTTKYTYSLVPTTGQGLNGLSCPAYYENQRKVALTTEKGGYSLPVGLTGSWPYRQQPLWGSPLLPTLLPVALSPAEIESNQTFTFYQGEYGEAYIKIKSPEAFSSVWTMVNPPASLGTLTLNAEGKLAGVPATVSSNTVNITVTNSKGTTTKAINIQILAGRPKILSIPVLKLEALQAFQYRPGLQYGTASSWSLHGPRPLPTGLSLNTSTGQISGTPTLASTPNLSPLSASAEIWDFTKYTDADFNSKNFYSSLSATSKAELASSTRFLRETDKTINLFANTYGLKLPVTGNQSVNRTYSFWIKTPYSNGILLYRDGDSYNAPLKLIELKDRKLIFSLSCYNRNISAPFSNIVRSENTEVVLSNQWNFITYVVNATQKNIKGYLNGVKIAEINASILGTSLNNVLLTNLSDYGSDSDFIFYRLASDPIFSGNVAYCTTDSTNWSDEQVFNAYHYTNPFKSWQTGNKYFTCLKAQSSRGDSEEVVLAFETRAAPPKILANQEIITGHGVAIKKQIIVEDSSNRPVSSWAASGLPTGVSINTTTGEISGSASCIKNAQNDFFITTTYTATITASNSTGSNSNTIKITVYPIPVIESAQEFSFNLQDTVNVNIVLNPSMALNSLQPKVTSWSTTAPGFKEGDYYHISALGLKLNLLTGTISGVASKSISNYTLQVTAKSLEDVSPVAGEYAPHLVSLPKTITFNVAYGAPKIVGAGSTRDFKLNSYAKFTVVAEDTANRPISTWQASGLPSGLSINSQTGVIEGTPNLAGTYASSVTATGAGGSTTASFNFKILANLKDDGTITMVYGEPVPSIKVIGSLSVISDWDIIGIPGWMKFNKTTSTLEGDTPNSIVGSATGSMAWRALLTPKHTYTQAANLTALGNGCGDVAIGFNDTTVYMEPAPTGFNVTLPWKAPAGEKVIGAVGSKHLLGISTTARTYWYSSKSIPAEFPTYASAINGWNMRNFRTNMRGNSWWSSPYYDTDWIFFGDRFFGYDLVKRVRSTAARWSYTELSILENAIYISDGLAIAMWGTDPCTWSYVGRITSSMATYMNQRCASITTAQREYNKISPSCHYTWNMTSGGYLTKEGHYLGHDMEGVVIINSKLEESIYVNQFGSPTAKIALEAFGQQNFGSYGHASSDYVYAGTGIRYAITQGKIAYVIYHKGNKTAWINNFGDLEYNFGIPNGLVRPSDSCATTTIKKLPSYYLKGRESVLGFNAEYVSDKIIYLSKTDNKAYEAGGSGRFYDTITVTGDTLVLDFEILPGVPIIKPSQTLVITVGEPVSWTPQLDAPVFRKPLSWNVQNLPTGLSFNTATGQITGVVYQYFTGDIVVTAANNAGSSTINIPISVRERVKLLVDNQILRGKVGESLSLPLSRLSVAGWESVTWQIPVGNGVSESLPEGLSYTVSSAGAVTITGTPKKTYLASTVAGIKEYYSVQVYATRNSDGLQSSPQSIKFEIDYGAPKFASTLGWPSSLQRLEWIKLEPPSATSKIPAELTVYGNGKFVACSYVSSDGLNFSYTPNTGFFDTKNWSASIFAADKFFVVSTDGKTIAQSTNGVNWTTTQTQIAAGYLAYGNSVMVSLDRFGAYSYSTNFTTWTNVATLYPAGYTTSKLIYGNGRFYILANAKIVDAATGAYTGIDTMIFSSVDGKNWTSVTRKYSTTGDYVESIAAHAGGLLGSLRVLNAQDSKLSRSYDHGASFGQAMLIQTAASQLESDGAYILRSGSDGGFLSADEVVSLHDWHKIHARGSIRYSNGKFLYYDSSTVAYAAPVVDVVDFKLTQNESKNYKSLQLDSPETRPLSSYIIKDKRTNTLVADSFDGAVFSTNFCTHLAAQSVGSPNIADIRLLGDLKYPLNIDSAPGSNVLSVTLIGPGGTSTSDVVLNISSPGELTAPFTQQGTVSSNFNCYTSSSGSNIILKSLGVELSEAVKLPKAYWASELARITNYTSQRPPCFTERLPDAVVGESYNYTLRSVGYYVEFSAPATLLTSHFAQYTPLQLTYNPNASIYERLPEGLALENWWITGTPTKPGTYIISPVIDTVKYDWIDANFTNNLAFSKRFYKQIKSYEQNTYDTATLEAIAYFYPGWYGFDQPTLTITVVDIPIPAPNQEVYVTLGEAFNYTFKLQNEDLRSYVTDWTTFANLPAGVGASTAGTVSGTVSDVSLVGTSVSLLIQANSTLAGKFYQKQESLLLRFKFKAPTISDLNFVVVQDEYFYEYIYLATSAVAPISSWEIVEGVPPTGSLLGTFTGILEGVCSTSGNFTFKVKAIGPGGSSNIATITVAVLRAPRKITAGQKLSTLAETPFSYTIKTTGGNPEDLLELAADTPQLGSDAPRNTAGTYMSVKEVIDSWYTQGTFKFVGSAAFITNKLFTGVKLPEIPLSSSLYYNSTIAGLSSESTKHLWAACAGTARAYIIPNSNSDILAYSTDGVAFTFLKLPSKDSWMFTMTVPDTSAIVGTQGIAFSIQDKSLKFWKYQSFASLNLPVAGSWVAGPSPSSHNFIENDIFLMLFSKVNTDIYTSRDGGNTWNLNARKKPSGVVVPMGELSGVSTTTNPIKAAYTMSYCGAADSKIVALVKRGQDQNPTQALTYIVSIDRAPTNNARWQTGRHVPGFYHMRSIQASADRIVAVGDGDKTYYIPITEHAQFGQPMLEGGTLPSVGVSSGNTWRYLVYAKNIFLAAKERILGDSDIAWSTDGESWESVTLPKLPEGYSWGNLNYNQKKGKFSLIAQTNATDLREIIVNNAYVLFSDDGIEWTSNFYIKAAFKTGDSALISPFEKIYLDIKPLPPSIPADITLHLEQFKEYDENLIVFKNAVTRPIDRWEITGLPAGRTVTADGITYTQKLAYSTYHPGKIAGVAPAAGTYENLNIKVFNSSGEASAKLTLNVYYPSPIIKPNQIFVVCAGDYQVDTVSKTIVPGPFSITPQLVRVYPDQPIEWLKTPKTTTDIFPAGITLDPVTGTISGKLQIPGDYVLRIAAVSAGAPIKREHITIRVVPSIPKLEANQEFFAIVNQTLTAKIALVDSSNSLDVRWELQSVYIPDRLQIVDQYGVLRTYQGYLFVKGQSPSISTSGYSVRTLDGVIQKTSYPSYETSRKTIVLTVQAWNTTHSSIFGFNPMHPPEEVKIIWEPLPELRDYQAIYGEVGEPIKLSTLFIDERGVWMAQGVVSNDPYFSTQNLDFKDGAKAKYLYTTNKYLDNSYVNGEYVITYSNGTYTGTSPAFKSKPDSIGLVATLRYPEGISFPALSPFPMLIGTPTKKISFTAEISAGLDAGQTTKFINVNIRGGVPKVEKNQEFVGYRNYAFNQYIKIQDPLNRPVSAVQVYTNQQGAGLFAGLQLFAEGSSGVRIAGTPTEAGLRAIRLQFFGDNTQKSTLEDIRIHIYEGLPRLKSDSVYYVEIGEKINIELEADPNFPPACTWKLSSDVSGLTLNDGRLTGAFNTLGEHTINITAGTCEKIYGPPQPLTVHVGLASPRLVDTQIFTGKQDENFKAVLRIYSKLSHLGVYTWEITGLPAGLRLHRLGYIEGIPTVSGEFEVVVTLSNSVGSSTANIKLSIAEGAVRFSYSTITMWVNEAFTQTLEASRGQAALWEAVGLPSGITLNSVTGELKGTPRSSGTFIASITLTGADFSKYTAPVRIVISQKLVISKLQQIKGTVGVGLYYRINYSNPGKLVISSWSASNLPEGLSISNSGIISGTPTASTTGVISVAVFSELSSATEDINITILGGVPAIPQDQTFSGRVGETLTAVVLAEDLINRPVMRWSITSLPAELKAIENVVSGIPKIKGSFNALVEASNDAGTTKQTITFNISEGAPKIKEGQSLGFSTFFTGVSQKIQLVDEINRPASVWAANNLPTGLILNSSDGTLTGVAAEGWYTVEVSASGIGGTSATETLNLVVAERQAKIFKTAANNLQILGENPQIIFYELKHGVIPEGLTFNNTTGKLSGAVNTDLVAYIVLEVTFADNTKELKPVVISTVDNLPELPQQTKKYKFLNQVNDATLNFSGKVNRFSVTALPEGLQFDEISGRIYGTPTKIENLVAVLKAENSGGFVEAPITFEIFPEYLAPMLTPFTSTQLAYRNRYIQNIQVQNTGGPIESWEISTLPEGLTFENFSQTLKGKPVVTGDFTITFKALNAVGSSEAVLNLQVISEIFKPVIAPNQVYSVTVGSALSEKIILTEGTADSYRLIDALPNSLIFNNLTGEISGNLDVLGESIVALTASNVEHTSAIETVKFIGISKKQTYAPVIEASQVITFYFGEENTYTLSSNKDYGVPASWKLADGYMLPSGITLDLNTGEIYGRPKTLGASIVKVIAANSIGNSAAESIQINVIASTLGPILASSQKVQGVQNQKINQQLVSTNSPSTWGVVSGNLPEQLSLNVDTGEIYGIPKIPGSYIVKIYAENTYGRTEEDVEITITPIVPEIVENQVIEGLVGVPIQYDVKYFNGVPTSWSIDGVLPEGVIFDGVKGTFTGTPTQTFNSTVTVSAINSGGETSQPVKLLIVNSEKIVLTANQRYYGKVGTFFNAQIVYTGVAPEQWQASSALPAGLILDASTGKISGNPTKVGVTSFNVTGYHSRYTPSTVNITIEIFSSSTSLKIITNQTFTFNSESNFSFVPSVLGEVISWRAAGLPVGTTIDSQTGEIVGKLPTGAYSFTLICKSAAATVTGTIRLKII